MTETKWFKCNDPDELYFDRYDAVPRPERRLQLFACGCCRQIWKYITDDRCRNAVEVAELEADGLATESQWDEAFDLAEEACDEIRADPPRTTKQTACYAAEMALRAPSDAAYPVACVLAKTSQKGKLSKKHKELVDNHEHLAFLAALFRDVFGNPFRLPELDRACLTNNICDLAQKFYDSRDFSLMSQLADLLEKAGCRNTEIIEHCRIVRNHIKGCWVIDLILNKQ